MRNRAGVHSNSTPRKAHPVRHGRKDKASPGGRSVLPNVRVSLECASVGGHCLPVKGRVFVHHLLENRVIARPRIKPFFSRCDSRPARKLASDINFRSLFSQVDDNAGFSDESIGVPSEQFRRGAPGDLGSASVLLWASVSRFGRLMGAFSPSERRH